MPNPPPSNNYKSQPPGCDFDAGTDLYIAIPLAGGGYINAGYMGQTNSYQLDNSGNLLATYTGFPGVYALTDSNFQSVPKQGYSSFATTGWFSVPSGQLVQLYNNLVSTGALSLGIWDIDPGDQYYDFTQGVANTITDIPLIPPEIISFTATPNTVVGSGTITLSWQTGATTSVAIDYGVNINPAQVNGSVQVTVSAPTTFTLTASSPQGAVTATATVTILPPLNITTTSLPAALAQSPYSQTLAATGGTAPYKWSVASGTLPAGLTLSPSGTISGTPTAAGTATFVAQATDSTVPAQAATAAYTLTVNPALAITTTSLPTAVATSPYTQTLAANGGTAPYSWALASGNLPTGLTLASNGSIAGTPTKTGSSTFTVRATDTTTPTPETATQSYTLTVGAQLAIQTNTLATGVVGAPYSQGLATAGGTAPYTWTLDSGPLPAGLSLTANGSINGTPTTAGITAFVVRVTDSTTPTAQTVTQTFSIYIAGQIAIDTTSLPDATAAHPYAQPLNAHNGVQPYVWTLASGTVPTGISLLATGALIGTPNVAGAYSFTLKATDSSIPTQQSATQSYTLKVDPAFTITTSALPGGSTGVAYSASIQATDGVAPYSFALVFGSLPPGLSLSVGGLITGTPTQPGIYNMLVRATDSTPLSAQSCDQPLTLTIDSNLSITTPLLPEGTEGIQYTETLAAINGLEPYTWGVTGGALPDGLSLLLSGAIVGNPTKAGTFNVTIQATDSSQPTPATSTRSYSLTINTPLTLTNASLPNGLTGTPYAAIFTTIGGQPQYTYSLTDGTLPTGLSLSPMGVITGTPTAAGNYIITVQVSDSSLTPSAVTKTYAISINQPLNITTAPAVPPATLDSLYSIQFTATGGLTPYTWTTQSTLPPGLQRLSTGVLIGVPGQAGSYQIKLNLADNTTPVPQTASLTTTLVVTPPLVITNNPFPSILPSVPYSAAARATGGVLPYTWTVASGSLPAGMTLNSDGTLAGVTTGSGSYTVQLTVTDSGNPQNSVTQEFVLLVAAPFAITSTSPLQTAVLGKSYSQSLTLAGGQTPFTWSVAGGSLPTGLTLVADGTLSGTPTTAGSANFVAQCKDAANETAIKPLTFLVQPALGIVSDKVPAVVTNTVYFHLFQPSAGTPPFHWTLTNGPLPAGLTLTDSGLLTGTASATGTFPITIGVTDATTPTPQNATAQISFAVIQALTAVTQTFRATTGVTFSQSLVATGGTSPYTWAIASGSLPPGLFLTGQTISGTPTAAGQYSLVLNVADATGLTASALYSISVTQQLSIPLLATSVPNATSGLSYAAVLSAFGGTPPYIWSISSGSLPPGLSLSTTGVISGLPAGTGSYTFTAVVVDSASQTANKAYTIQVQPPPPSLTISPASAALPAALVGAAYAASLTVSGGTPPYTWAVASGSSLPTGFSLNGTALVGTPTTPGTYSFALTAKDATGLSTTSIYVLTVGAGLIISTPSLPPAVTGTPYSAALTAAGGTPPYSWSGTLPTGLKLSSSGVVSGTLSSTMNSTASVTVTDSSKPALTAAKTYNLTLQTGLSIAITNPPAMVQGTSSSLTLQATGGTSPYTWSVTGGILPPGLTLAAPGTVTGTPTAAGSYATTFTVSDSSQPPLNATAQVVFSITGALTFVTTSLLNATTGSQYSPVLQVQGGTPPYSWTISSGTLPSGLTLNGGAIVGIPTTPGIFAFTVKVTDAAGQTASEPFKLTVVAVLSITTTILPTATATVPFTYTVQAIGGTPPYTWGLQGSLPAGLSLDRTGIISGTPTTAGSSTFVLVLVDNGTLLQHTTATITLTVNSSLAITTSALPPATTALLYRAPITATGGTPPYTWRVSFGALPTGLVLTSDGVLTGIPVATASANVTIQVTDSQAATASANYTIQVNPAPAVGLLISPSSPTLNPLTQQPVQIALASPYPTDLAGQISLTGTQDPDAVFIQNSQTALSIPFTIRAGTTTATFTGGPVLLQSGTSSQPFSINATTTTPAQSASQQFSVLPLPPQITGTSYSPGSGSFTITLQGFSTTREVSQATFRFFTNNQSSAPYTMSVADIFKTWYQNPQSSGSGIFKYVQPFTLTGDLASVTSVQVTLTNSAGTSPPATISMEARQ
jgi:hypothetical protein